MRRLAYEAADSGLLSPELAAGIRRVKGVKQLGSRAGNWLTRAQARLLLEKADSHELRGIRDLAMISVLLGCGLRRAELSALEVEDLQIRQGHWAIVDLVGKGGLRRTCAKLCHVNGGEIEQVQFLLGHASVLTTERYLGCKQNLEKPVNDRFGCLFAFRTVELR